MDKIIIIDNTGIREEVEKFIFKNRKHILFASDLDEMTLNENPVLKEIIANYEEQNKIKIHTKSRIWFFKGHEIIRIEGREKDTVIYLSDKHTRVLNESIDEIENQLKDFSFIRIHRNHIVNINYLSKIAGEKTELTTGDVLPIEPQLKQYIAESIEKYHDKQNLTEAL